MLVREVAVVVFSLMVTAGCTSDGRGATDTTVSADQPPRPADVTPLPASSTALKLPTLCAPDAVGRQLAGLMWDVNAGDGAGAWRRFEADGLWEAYDHMNPPNGVRGGLTSEAAVKAFVQEVRRRGEVWAAGRLASPVGPANLPAATGYGLTLAITAGPTSRRDGGKVAISCRTGRIIHMVAPIGAHG